MTTDDAIRMADDRCQAAIDSHYARIKATQRVQWEYTKRSQAQRWRRLTESLLRDYIALQWANYS